jgi:hypothetical protein
MSKNESFIGMKIHKKECISECVGFEDYIKKNGEKIMLLVWKCVFSDQTVSTRKTSLIDFRIGDLPSKKGKND